MITVLGSINVDRTARVERLPRPGETLGGGQLRTSPGGKGANQALAARRAGAEVRMVGAVGTDASAEPALAFLKADGVDLSGVRIVEAATGAALIFVDANGENVIAVCPGANDLVSREIAEAALGRCKAGDLLLLQQEIPLDTVECALRIARQRAVTSILNVAPFVDGLREIAPLASIVIANEREFEELHGGGSDPLRHSVRKWAHDRRQTVIVTMGAAGVFCATADEAIEVSAPAVAAIDTVGAGDTFCGYLAAIIDRGETWRSALEGAVRAASSACERHGAQTAIPRREELVAFR